MVVNNVVNHLLTITSENQSLQKSFVAKTEAVIMPLIRVYHSRTQIEYLKILILLV
jgi:hypothetical protein